MTMRNSSSATRPPSAHKDFYSLMRFPIRFALFALAVTSARAEELQDILARMDQAALKFQSFTATTKSYRVHRRAE